MSERYTFFTNRNKDRREREDFLKRFAELGRVVGFAAKVEMIEQMNNETQIARSFDLHDGTTIEKFNTESFMQQLERFEKLLNSPYWSPDEKQSELLKKIEKFFDNLEIVEKPTT